VPVRQQLGVSPDDAVNVESDELDRQDMRRLVSGQEAALDDLMNRHGRRLFNYLTRHLGNEAEAKDCVQEAFVRVYVHRAKFQPSASFLTWLYTIAMNCARNMKRARRHEICLDDESAQSDLVNSAPDSAANASEQLQLREQTEEIRRAVLALPEELRAPLVLFEFESLSQSEIAQILGCTRKAVEVRIYRARQILRKALTAQQPTAVQGHGFPN